MCESMSSYLIYEISAGIWTIKYKPAGTTSWRRHDMPAGIRSRFQAQAYARLWLRVGGAPSAMAPAAIRDNIEQLTLPIQQASNCAETQSNPTGQVKCAWRLCSRPARPGGRYCSDSCRVSACRYHKRSGRDVNAKRSPLVEEMLKELVEVLGEDEG
jgi:hypothetical protein